MSSMIYDGCQTCLTKMILCDLSYATPRSTQAVGNWEIGKISILGSVEGLREGALAVICTFDAFIKEFHVGLSVGTIEYKASTEMLRSMKIPTKANRRGLSTPNST